MAVVDDVPVVVPDVEPERLVVSCCIVEPLDIVLPEVLLFVLVELWVPTVVPLPLVELLFELVDWAFAA